MAKQLLKPITVGLLAGVALYFLPIYFIGKAFFFLIILFLFFGFFRRRYHGGYGWQYADKIRSMSDADYLEFKTNYRGRCGYSSQTSNETKS